MIFPEDGMRVRQRLVKFKYMVSVIGISLYV